MHAGEPRGVLTFAPGCPLVESAAVKVAEVTYHSHTPAQILHLCVAFLHLCAALGSDHPPPLMVPLGTQEAAS